MIVPLGSRRGDHAHCPPIHATTPRKHLAGLVTSTGAQPGSSLRARTPRRVHHSGGDGEEHWPTGRGKVIPRGTFLPRDGRIVTASRVGVPRTNRHHYGVTLSQDPCVWFPVAV